MERWELETHGDLCTAHHAIPVKALLLSAALASSLITAFAQTTPPALTAENSDLYFGYYLEDPVNNPEDPTPGALLLRLPKTDSAFAGALYFTFVGCQTESWGHIQGRLERGRLQGQWSGNVDDSPQNGTFQGQFDPQTRLYSGTFDNARGKQFREIQNCISYHIAARGTWQMFTPENLCQGNFPLTARWPYVEWREAPVEAFVLLYVLDQSLLNEADPQRAVVEQVIVEPGDTRHRLPTSKLREGQEYTVIAMAFDQEMKPIGRSSITVTRRPR